MNMMKNITRVLIASLIIPIAVMMLTLMVYEYSSTSRIYRNSMAMITRRVNSAVENYFDSLTSKLDTDVNEDTFEVFFRDDVDEATLQRAEAEFEKMAGYSNFVEKIVITNAAGRTVAGGIDDVSMYIDRNKFEKARKSMESVIDTNFTYLDGKVMFTLYIPVSFDARVTDAMIIQWVNVGVLENLIASGNYAGDEKIFIIDSNSNVLGYSKEGKLEPLASFNNPDGLMQNIKSVMSWSTDTVHAIKYKDIDDVKKSAVFWRNSKYDMTIVCEKENAVIMRSTAIIIVLILFFAVLMLVISIVNYLKAQQMIKKPIDEAIQTMHEYETGNFSYRPVISGNDEISNITGSLWNMAMKISDIYEDIRENEHCFRKAMEFASDMLTDYTVSKNTYVTDKEQWHEMFGFEFVGNEKKMDSEIKSRVHEEDKKQFKAYRDKIFADIYDNLEKQMQLEFRMRLKDNEYHWILRRDILVRGKTEDIEHVLTSYAVIDDRKKNELELSSKAHYDQMTKLYNRATFMAKAKEWMRVNNQKECSMIFVDADNFKFVNDTYGHEAGDDVIRYIADTLKKAVDDKGICGRYGGDEFIAFVYDKADAVNIAKDVVENLPKDFAVPSQENVVLSMHTSVGVAYYPEHAYDVENLLKRADEAMYVSKKSGKDRYTVFDNSIQLA